MGQGKASVMAAPSATIEKTKTGLFRVQGLPFRRWTTTTPGRLGVASVVLVIGLIVVAAVGTLATASRNSAARAVGLETVPALVAAENLYGALADADATASTIYLDAGLEAPALRQRYLADLDEAGEHLAVVADAAGTSPAARRAVRAITEQLPRYAELVGDARFNSRQGFPVGARYLHDASVLMRDDILPAATTIYLDASRRLDDNYESGTSSADVVLVVGAGVLLIALLVGVQVFVTRRTRRILNVALVTATVLVAVVLVAAVLQFNSSQNALVRAQEDGSDTVQLLSTARILTQRMSSDDSLALIERGTGDVYLQDYDQLHDRVAGEGNGTGLLAAAIRSAADGTRDDVKALEQQFAAFHSLHQDVRTLDDNGEYQNAVDRSTLEQANAVQALDRGYRAAIADAAGSDSTPTCPRLGTGSPCSPSASRSCWSPPRLSCSSGSVSASVSTDDATPYCCLRGHPRGVRSDDRRVWRRVRPRREPLPAGRRPSPRPEQSRPPPPPSAATN